MLFDNKYGNFSDNRFKFSNNKDKGINNNSKINLIFAVIWYTICLMVMGSCSIYKVDIRQGMDIDDKQLFKLVPKLSKQQVQQILGSSNLDQLNSDRFDYYYLNKTNNHNTIVQKHLSLFFNSKGELVCYTGNVELKNLPRKNN